MKIAELNIGLRSKSLVEITPETVTFSACEAWQIKPIFPPGYWEEDVKARGGVESIRLNNQYIRRL